MEVWKDIKEYENLYKISNLGRVKSLNRLIKEKRGFREIKERILKQGSDSGGYKQVNLYKDKKPKRILVHKLVAVAFLNHKPKETKLVVNHINFNKVDNRVENLEIITQRENTNLKHIKSSSKYVGVCWHKRIQKWRSRIVINGKSKHLGNFKNEYDAHLSYQKALKELENDRRTV